LAFGLLVSLTASLLAEGVDDSRPSRGGITVHGHWIIDVLDPDGTVVTQREFDNAITQSGRGFIARVLARTNYLSPWEIELGSSTGNGPCAGAYFGGVPNNSSCWIVDVGIEPLAYAASYLAVFPTGTTTVGGAGGAQVILTGRITALTAGEINRVATHRTLCPLGNPSPYATTTDSCLYTGPGEVFTSHDLTAAQGPGAPLPVTAGQIVQVTVTVSFCSSEEGCL
jgi:hypothetical protein